MQAPFVREILQEGIEQGLAGGLGQGLEQRRKQGLAKDERLLVVRRLRRRLGPLAPDAETTIAALPLERLEARGDALLGFQSFAELYACLRTHAAPS